MAAVLHCRRCKSVVSEDDPNPCRRCRTDPWPYDTMLRANGWQVYARPQYGPATWRKQGIVLAQAEALAAVRAGET